MPAVAIAAGEPLSAHPCLRPSGPPAQLAVIARQAGVAFWPQAVAERARPPGARATRQPPKQRAWRPKLGVPPAAPIGTGDTPAHGTVR